MALRSRHWIWFTTRQEWIAGTPLGARERFINWGQDVVWGKVKPHRPGADWSGVSQATRVETWYRFSVRTMAEPASRHAVASS